MDHKTAAILTANIKTNLNWSKKSLKNNPIILCYQIAKTSTKKLKKSLKKKSSPQSAPKKT